MKFLEKLGINSNNPGASDGIQWLKADPNINEINSINPANENLIAKISPCSVQQYEKIIAQSQKTFLEWRQVPAPKRGELVRVLGNLLREHKDLLGNLVSLEMGKSKQEGDGEVQEMIDMADFAVGQSRMLYGLTMHSERPHHRMYEQWHPLGITGIISAFNFPVAVWAWNAFIAAICGNTVVWKPSSKVPLCAVAVQNLCLQAMQQCNMEGVFSLVITDDNALAEKLVLDPQVPLISFTGSCEVGNQVYEKVASRMGRAILELGGNNGIIVDETADLNLAIPAIVFGAIGTAGQRCTSTRRVFVHQSRWEEIKKSLIAAYQQISIGDPLDSKNLMGPLIDQGAVKQYIKAIDEIHKTGGKILFGGNVLKQTGFYVEPTLVEAKNSWPLVQRETFAPILYLIRYDHFEEALSMHNEVEQGLSSALFTQSLLHAERFLSAWGSDCGIANINIGTSGAEIGGAFGGEKATGGGRESGSDSWKAYMRRQTNTINWGKDLPLAQGIEFKVNNPTDNS